MKKVFISWIGNNDLKGMESQYKSGAILSILTKYVETFDEVVVLANLNKEITKERVVKYFDFLKNTYSANKCKFVLENHHNDNPTDYAFIYMKANDILQKYSDITQYRINLNITSGTPAMIATWIFLGTAIYDAELYQSSLQRGVEKVKLPYQLSILQRKNSIIEEIFYKDQNFNHIQTNSQSMQEAVRIAQLVAKRDVSVLIHGETGTGKEILAKAIHSASQRYNHNFIAINCGAIAETLIEAQLFGSKKGAFTGAENQQGFFQAAHKGTLFLDEIGELSLGAQVKLLRVLQEGVITPLGETREIKVDVRIVSATHRDLLQMVNEGTFREDLFYRLAIGVIQLPNLAERKEDIPELVNVLLEKINQKFIQDKDFKGKKMSCIALDFIVNRYWKGNIRELENTLLRAAIWNPSISILDVDHIEHAVIRQKSSVIDFNLSKNLDEAIDLKQMINKIKHHYIELALATTKNKKQAAELLGLGNTQTLDNWLKS